MSREIPRLVISAVGGDGGKTLLSLGIASAFGARGLKVSAFKKGPDYIDAAWLSLATRRAARNLDTFLAERAKVRSSFTVATAGTDVALIEGNRGLFDGLDRQGTHSTAALARLLNTPIVLVLDATKVTRTLGAVALGCQLLEKETPLAAFVLNRVGTPRHEQIARASIEEATGLPVIGALPRLQAEILPGRHLGLVTPEEHQQALEAIQAAQRAVGRSVDVARLLEIAGGAPRIGEPFSEPSAVTKVGMTVGVVRDSAFSFYYPENLEALESEGADLLEISSLELLPLPSSISALYIGGGFPETHAARISANTTFLSSLRKAAEEGMPIYAECGGLMLLSRSITWEGRTYPMAGVFQVDIAVQERPAGHGYCVIRVDADNPFFEIGTTLRGHEFHYSFIQHGQRPQAVFAMERGVGCFDKRDGLVYKNVLASYAHLHALGSPEWSRGFIEQAGRFRRKFKGKHWPGEADP